MPDVRRYLALCLMQVLILPTYAFFSGKRFGADPRDCEEFGNMRLIVVDVECSIADDEDWSQPGFDS